MAAADASLGGPIEGPAEWSEARECDQTAGSLTPKAQRTWDRRLGWAQASERDSPCLHGG